MYSIECKLCNKIFAANHFNCRYCSIECKKEALKIQRNKRVALYKEKRKQLTTKKCLYCKKEFEDIDDKRIFCSIQCRRKNRNLKRREKNKKESNCLWCGNVFIKTKKNRKYCCEQCRKKRNTFYASKSNKTEEYRKKRRKYMKQYRGVLKNKLKKREYDYSKRFRKEININYNFLEKLLENTLYCPKCGVKLNEIQNDPQQKTIDHMTALSNGGMHSGNNIMIICKSCNSKKRNFISQAVS